MLRNKDKAKLDRSELVKLIEEQQCRIADHERKLRDIVRAYKGLNAEKDALQAAVEALSLKEGVTASVQEQQSDSGDEKSLFGNSTKKELLEGDRVEILKRSLAVLIAEKDRREAAYQSDRKALLVENEALKERLQKAADETEAQAEKLESRLMDLRSKIQRIEGDREKELADHGSVLAAIQQQYAKERASTDQLKKQIAELCKKMSEKEAQNQLETDVASLKADLSRAQSDLDFWKKKADKMPTIQMLQIQLQDLKESSRSEIAELKNKLMEANNAERENRLRELEQRLHEMTAEMGDFDRIRADLLHRIDQLEKNNKILEEENILLKTAHSTKGSDNFNFESLKENFLKIAQKLRDSQHEINFYELLGLEEISCQQKRHSVILEDECERYKLNDHAMLRNGSENNNTVGNTDMPLECSSCEANLRYARSIVASLQNKLYSLEIDHANAKNDYEEKTAHLKRRIVELQMTQENSASELRSQMYQKVAEMESEMQKQRIRTLEILAEKENELEITKAVLASSRNQNNANLMDYPQSATPRPSKYCKSQQHEFEENNISVDEERKATGSRNVIGCPLIGADSFSSAVDELRSEHSSASLNDIQLPFIFSGAAGVAEARNIFYEQQLAKKEKDIVELRNAVQLAESNVRNMQQASLIKDLQQYEMVEKLKDEIRVLEGKLNFLNSDANMEYLRNIFIQLLHCNSSSGRKHILKAIGAVLKLSITEMGPIEKHGH